MECSVASPLSLLTLLPWELPLITSQSRESKMLSCFARASPWWLLGPSYVGCSTELAWTVPHGVGKVEKMEGSGRYFQVGMIYILESILFLSR